MQKQTPVKTALLGLMVAGTLGAVGSAAAGGNAMGKMGHQDMQKCYGVNAANKNDCKSPGHSCAGQDAKARDANAFVVVPSGLCGKLAGGSLKSGADSMMHHKAMKRDTMSRM